MIPLLFSRRWWWTTLLVLGGIALAIRLGFWQVDRYRQNQAFATHLKSVQLSEQLTLDGAQAPADLTSMEYRKVEATGTFDFDHQVAVRNQVWTQGWGDEMGYILITPLVFSDGSAVLVDRGWIPLGEDTRQAWQKYDQPGLALVSGVIRLPAHPQIGGQPDPTLAPGQTTLDFWNLIDIPRLQLQIPYPLLPVYIQAGRDPARIDPPYRALPEPELSEPGVNIGYSIMWFSFATLLLVGYPVYLKKQSAGPGSN